MDDDLIGVLLRLGAVAFLVVVNGFFVATEFALVAVRRTRIDQLIAEGHRGAQAVRRALDNIDDFVAAAQLGITMASLGLGWIAEPAIARLLLPLLGFLGPAAQAASHGLAVTLAFILITAVHIILGEQAPKVLAIQHAERTSLFVARPTELFLVTFKPFIRFLAWAARRVVLALGLKPPEYSHTLHSDEEIKMLLAASEAAGLVEKGEREMIGRIFSLFDLVTSQVMVPRTEMVGIPATSTLRQLQALAAEHGYSRYPVYGENMDDVVGVVSIRDLVAALEENHGRLDQPVTTIMRPAVSVPGSLPVGKLLAQMRDHRTRLVIVLDEYGGTAGMVSRGDLLERIMGEVEEYTTPEEERDIERLEDGTWRVSGLLLTEDIDEHLGISIKDEHNDTIGGVVFSRLGRKPEVNDEVEIGGYIFRVEALDGLRIDRLRVFPVQVSLEGHENGRLEPASASAGTEALRH